MKKRYVLPVAILFLLLVSSSTAADVNLSELPLENQTVPVKGFYQPAEEPKTIYSIDISWGDMNFTYTEDDPGTWNPDTHEYDNQGGSGWSCKDGSNSITITNHSNAPLSCVLIYQATEEFKNIPVSPAQKIFSLLSAENTAPTNAPTETITYQVEGTSVPKNFLEGTLGNITIEITNDDIQ